jgi:tetratricopeptide (TPR) repeat protein
LPGVGSIKNAAQARPLNIELLIDDPSPRRRYQNILPSPRICMEMSEPGGWRFVDVPTLLQTSVPRPRIVWMRFVFAGALLGWAFAWYFGRENPQAQDAISLVLTVGLGLLVGMMGLTGVLATRAQAAERAQLEAIEDLIELRRWPDAAMMVQAFLLRPTRSMGARAQALLSLAMVMVRYHRFEESVTVYDYILREVPMDPGMNHAVQLGRAMAMLREDNLLDADRAIAELRRGSRGIESAGLALVELYRDVKTGHPAEAIEIFEKQLPVMRRMLGHRLADAWGLAARAYDLLSRESESREAYANATVLAPLVELQRRYPEIVPLAEKFTATAAPVEVA